MRWWIALVTAIVFVCGFLAWKSSLIAEVHSEIAKLDLTVPPEGYGTKVPKELERKIAIADLLQTFQIPIVIMLVVIPVTAAFIWPRALTEELTPLPTENRDS